MNDIRRSILWMVFLFSAVMLWDRWQIHTGGTAMLLGAPTTGQSTVQPGKKETSVPAAQTIPGAPSSASVGSGAQNSATLVPSTSAFKAAVKTPAPAVGQAKETVEVNTDVLKLTFDKQGGTLVRSELINYRDKDDKNSNVILQDQSAKRVYLAQTGLIGDTPGVAFPTHETPMVLAQGPLTLQNGQNELTVRFESDEVGGLTLVKSYTFKRGKYDIVVKHEVINTGAYPLSPQLYLQLVRDGNKPEGESSFYSTFTGPALYTESKKYQKIAFEDIEKGKVDIEKQASNGFVAMVQHYFVSAWILADGIERSPLMNKVGTNLYAAGLLTPVGSIAPGGGTKTLEAKLFVGPQEETQLQAIAPGLELVKDYGLFTILSKPLYWLLNKLHTFIGNWGWSIVALVLLLKIAFYSLNAHAYRSMGKMKAIGPKVAEMRERLKSKPQELQREMIKIYREEKVNPLGGCLPILVQIPVFIALYWVLLSSVEMRNAPWIGWVKDLAAPDPLYILPLAMTATTVLQTWLNPTPPDPLQAKMMWIMPLVFSVMFFFFPAGLVLYWFTNNVLSIAQQALINKRLGLL